MDELRERIADTRPAADEVTPIDADALVRRGRRQRRTVQAVTGVAGVLLVVVLAFGAGSLVAPPGPEVADERGPQLVDPPIGLLDKPAGPQDELPRQVRAGAGIDNEAAATLRLARTTPSHRWFLYLDDAPSGMESTDRVVCLLVVEVRTDEVPQTACGGSRVPASSEPRRILGMSVPEHGMAGVVTDGANRVGQASGFGDSEDVDADLPVVNNVFVDGPPLDDAATDGRSREAFCATAPAPDVSPDVVPGSAEHLALLENMAIRAPLEIAPDLHLVWDHIRGNMSPDDPASQSTDSFPPPVQAAIERVDNYIRANCPQDGADTSGS